MDAIHAGIEHVYNHNRPGFYLVVLHSPVGFSSFSCLLNVATMCYFFPNFFFLKTISGGQISRSITLQSRIISQFLEQGCSQNLGPA